ncbi:hypothetical protein HDU91_004917 [Kappamyces sp. JEL0680]|nr:hypothetical protein HDU91_004917 [Kappamyces sp. JEL0680]
MIGQVFGAVAVYPTPCELILVFDGVSVVANGKKEEWKSGRISQASLENYQEFQARCKEHWRTDTATETTDFDFSVGTNTLSRVRSERLSPTCLALTHSIRVGFALAVYSAALQASSTSSLIFVQQHDWLLTDDCISRLSQFAAIMQQEEQMNYLGFLSRRTLRYTTHNHPKLLQRQKEDSETVLVKQQLAFCRAFFWWDKPHFVKKAFLLNNVFSVGRFKRGDFIEDVYGHSVMQACKEHALHSPEGWAGVGAYLYYPDQGTTAGVRHLNGRKFFEEGVDQRALFESRRAEQPIPQS